MGNRHKLDATMVTKCIMVKPSVTCMWQAVNSDTTIVNEDKPLLR